MWPSQEGEGGGQLGRPAAATSGPRGNHAHQSSRHKIKNVAADLLTHEGHCERPTSDSTRDSQGGPAARHPGRQLDRFRPRGPLRRPLLSTSPWRSLPTRPSVCPPVQIVSKDELLCNERSQIPPHRASQNLSISRSMLLHTKLHSTSRTLEHIKTCESSLGSSQARLRSAAVADVGRLAQAFKYNTGSR